MSDSNRVVVQEGYLLPFQAYRGGSRRTPTAARQVQAIGYNKNTRRPVNVRAPSRRGHGRKSAAYVKQQSKMKSCAKRWRSEGEGSYRAFMRDCLKK